MKRRCSLLAIVKSGTGLAPVDISVGGPVSSKSKQNKKKEGFSNWKKRPFHDQQTPPQKPTSRKKNIRNALAGSRTRASSVAGRNLTAGLQVLVRVSEKILGLLMLSSFFAKFKKN
jgi:hypothetical protein